MKKSSLHGNLKEFMEKRLGFPLVVPISFDNSELGEVIIDFKPNIQGGTDWKSVFRRTLMAKIYIELSTLSRQFLKRDLELIFKRRHKSQIDQQLGLRSVAIELLPFGKMIELIDFISFNDEDLFAEVKSEGPISLRSAQVQERINQWLVDKSIAAKKINKLGDALKEYAYEKSAKDLRVKEGPLETDIVKKLGLDTIRNFYHDVTSILKIAKKKRKNNIALMISELIDISFKEFYFSLKKKYEKQADSEESRIKLRRLEIVLEDYESHPGSNPLSFVIEKDEDLKAEFESYRWEPNKLAKEITAKVLSISMSTLESILYRKHK